MKINCLLMVGLMTAPVAAQVRDVPRADTGTAALSGTVVADEQNGQPVKRALITLLPAGDARQQRQTATDDRGRFTFTGLPAGNVTLIASKPAYVTTYYGARQPGSNMGTPIALTDGRETTVTIQLSRGAVIAGTVFDENGQPMPSVSIRIRRVVVSPLGERTLVPPTTSALVPSSDDRGAYRVFGLPAGDYVVSAQPRMIGGAEIRQPTTAELQWAERQIKGGAGMAAGLIGTTEAAPAMAQTITYASVFYPGTVNAASAGVISLAAGQERGGIDVRMQFVPTARVEGTVASPDGRPAGGVQVTLIPKSDGGTEDVQRMVLLLEIGLASGAGGRTGADGAFRVEGVEPGQYVLLARTGGPAGRGRAPASAATWARTDVDVQGRDIAGLALQLAPGLNVSGRFAFEGQTPAPASPRVSVSLRAVDSTGVSASAIPGLQPADGTFSIAGVVPAPYRLSATLAGWTLKSVVMNGRDVADVPIEIPPGDDVRDIIVAFTDVSTEVTGVLYDGANRPTSDLSIVLFAADRAMWFAGSRRVRPPVRPASDGRFTFSGLAPGEYYLAALTDVSASDLANPQFLEQVAPAAVRIAVAAGEKKTQDLRIAR